MGVGPNYKKKEPSSRFAGGRSACRVSSYSSPSTTSQPKLPNPDPNNFKVMQVEEIGQFLIMKIVYPDCTNYEGQKILVFKGVKIIDLLNQRLIDPHFFQDKKCASPIARFVPTIEGWNMAKRFALAEIHSLQGTVGVR